MGLSLKFIQNIILGLLKVITVMLVQVRYEDSNLFYSLFQGFVFAFAHNRGSCFLKLGMEVGALPDQGHHGLVLFRVHQGCLIT